MESCPELFKSNTMKITIGSKGHPNLRSHIIRQLISDKTTILLNYGRGDTWYFSSDAYDVTKLHNTIKTHGPYTLKFTNYDKTRIDGTLRWVPPSPSNETLVEALNIFSQKEQYLNIIPHTSNRSFTVYTDKPKTIPHYITLNYKDKFITILIALPGRKQACQHCASTQHWTNHCKQPHLSRP